MRLRQVLVNLFSNAIKFTESGHVSFRIKMLSTPPVNGQSSQPLLLHFSVQDTGIGITPDKISRLFKAFMQAEVSTARQYGGTGIGAGHQQKAGGNDGWENVGGERAGQGFHVSFHGEFSGRTAGRARHPAAAPRRPEGADCRRQCGQPTRPHRAGRQMGHGSAERGNAGAGAGIDFAG